MYCWNGRVPSRPKLRQPIEEFGRFEPSGTKTLDPAANAESTPEIKPCPWKRGSTLSNRSCSRSFNTAPTLHMD